MKVRCYILALADVETRDAVFAANNKGGIHPLHYI